MAVASVADIKDFILGMGIDFFQPVLDGYSS